MNKLPNTPPKGTADWDPVEFSKRSYIFSVWRKVAQQYGFQEYLTPIVESAEIYRAKSGEDVGGTELVTFRDRADRELAIRPEMTPSVTRMVSRTYTSTPKPIRMFSIANFMRNEKPQRGRNREFWQLNVDIFGSESNISDVEILSIANNIMKGFNAPTGSYTIKVNHRHIIDTVLQVANIQNKTQIVRLLDKWHKLDRDTLKQTFLEYGESMESLELITKYMQTKELREITTLFPSLESDPAIETLRVIFESIPECIFAPDIIRGFDYYDGMIFEVFDNHPDNNRAMFGGGRYNGLAEIFGQESFPAVGFAPGDETTYLFLESHNLFPQQVLSPSFCDYLLPIFEGKDLNKYLTLADTLRKRDISVILNPYQKIGDALSFADKHDIPFVAIMGPDEIEAKIYKVKNMKTGQENIASL